MFKWWRPLTLGLVLFLATSGQVRADDFFDIVHGYAVIGSGANSRWDGQLFNGRVTGGWNDKNGNGDFDDDESIESTPSVVYDRNGKAVISSPLNLTRDQLEDWAKANSKAILDALLGGSGSDSVGISDDGVMAQGFFDAVIFKSAAARSRAKETVEKSAGATAEVGAAVEYSLLDVNNDSGNAYSALLNYERESESGLRFGALLPYRFSQIDDQEDTRGHYLGLNLYAAYPVLRQADLQWNVGADIFGSAFYSQTEPVEHYGFLKYGGGLFTSVAKELVGGTLTVGLDYKISKAYMPDSFDSTDDSFLGDVFDYINDLDPVHSLSYGFDFFYPVTEALQLNLEVVRTSFFSDDIDSDRANQTQIGLSGSYFVAKSFELNLGVKHTFEIEDVTATSFMLGTVYKF